MTFKFSFNFVFLWLIIMNNETLGIKMIPKVPVSVDIYVYN